MCPLMAAEQKIHGVLPERLLVKQIAATARKIHWSYALFWSLSAREPGTLVWSAGCYNGQIKTRKTTRLIAFDADQLGLQRSKQLRELYESLTLDACNQQTKRPCASLSPEDLTDIEWYYLVCMSFTFTLGQGLPGKALAKNQYIWLNNATLADPMFFNRSLLAKGAGIQTIVCIPIMGGVLELGTIKQVNDDPALVMRITSLFWEIPNPVCTVQSISSPIRTANEVDNCIVLEEQNLIIDSQTLLESVGPTNISLIQPPQVHTEKELDKQVINEPRTSIFEELNVGSPKDNSNECCPTQQLEDLFGIDGLNSMSQTKNEQLMDDDFSNVLHGSFKSNEDMTMSFVNAQRTRNKIDNPQGDDRNMLTSLDLDGEDSHYTRTVTLILQNSKPDRQVLCSLMASHDSSFVGWRGDFNTPTLLPCMPQKLLKKILVHRAWVQSNCQIKQHQEEKGLQDKVSCPKGESGANHVLSEKRRRDQLSEKFLVLRSLIPSISKMDKVSVLGDTIEYLKELQRRVQQLETCKHLIELNTTNHLDIAKRTSDNCCSKEMMNSSRKPLPNKRKACETDIEYHWVLSRGGPISINVTVKGKEVLVEMHCPWRECLLVQIVESMSDLHMDPLMVQSSIINGTLALIIKSKFRSSTAASPGMIKGSLERAIGRCL